MNLYPLWIRVLFDREAIFAPLEDGDVYLKRLTPIYEMLDPADFEGDSTPGYFNGKLVETSEETLKDYGQFYFFIFAVAPL